MVYIYHTREFLLVIAQILGMHSNYISRADEA